MCKGAIKILPAGHTETEIFNWMQDKIQSHRQLQAILSERDACKLKLSELEAEVERLTNLSALEVTQKDLDPSHPL